MTVPPEVEVGFGRTLVSLATAKWEGDIRRYNRVLGCVPDTAHPSMKTLLIGLDAATWRRIDPLLEQGDLPAIADLIDSGVRGTLTSTMPPMTPLAWTSISTGANPGKHGVFDFLEQNQRTYELSPFDFARTERPALWDLLNGAGVGVGVVNYPAVDTGTEADPFFVSGIPAEIGDEIATAEVRSVLREFDYRVHPRTDPGRDPDGYFDEVVSITESQRDVVLALYERYEPDVLWPVFMGIDWIQHYLWNETVRGEDAVDEFYRFIDGIVGQLVGAIGDDWTVVVLSDHGAREIDGAIHTNTLVEEWGYLGRTEESRSVAERIRTGALGWAHSLGARLPRGVKRVIKERLSEDALHEARKAVGASQLHLAVDIDWRRTEAFAFGYMGRLFVHDESRYPDGVVSEAEYDELVTELMTRLEGLEHPESGVSLVERAVPATEVYDGPYTAQGPDVLFVPTDWRYMVYGNFGENWITEPRGRVADHDSEGIVVVDGPMSGTGTVDMHVTDIAPTLLYLHDVALLDDMDGNVQMKALADSLTASRDPRTVEHTPEFTPVDRRGTDVDDDLTQRLDDLGYL